MKMTLPESIPDFTKSGMLLCGGRGAVWLWRAVQTMRISARYSEGQRPACWWKARLKEAGVP